VSHGILSRAVLARLLPARLLAQGPATTVYQTIECPLPPSVQTYTLVVRYDSARTRDTTYFRQLANHTGGYLRALPDDERRVGVTGVLRRDGSLKASRISARSGDRDFDGLALRAFRDAVRSGTLGPLPADLVGDTLTVHLLFGEAPLPGEYAVRRFARQSRLPRLLSDSVRLSYVTADSSVARRKGTVVLLTMVDTTGSPDPQTRVLKASSDELGLVARQLATRLRFEAGQSNCAPLRYGIWVRFTFDGRGMARVRVVP
jgi:hypothetical protein